jgi:hypothetical protein
LCVIYIFENSPSEVSDANQLSYNNDFNISLNNNIIIILANFLISNDQSSLIAPTKPIVKGKKKNKEQAAVGI